MRSKKHKHITVLDIGTSKMACFVVNVPANIHSFDSDELLQAVSIVSALQLPSEGIKNGALVDIDKASRVLKTLIERSEAIINHPIDEAWINLSCGTPKTHYIKRKIMTEGIISKEEVEKVTSLIINDVYKKNDYIVHAVPLTYALDSMSEVQNPIGMRTSNLELEMHVVSAERTSVRNWGMMVENAHIEIAGRALSPYAAAWGCLTESEKQAGTILIDIGAQTISIAVVKGEKLVYTDMLKMGSDYITQDIAQFFSVSQQTAENLKCTKGTCQVWGIEHDKIELPVMQEGGYAPIFETAPRETLVKIIRARMGEMIENIQSHLKSKGLTSLPYKLVLTGGGSQLLGLAEFYQEITHVKPKIAYPTRLVGMPQNMSDPAYSVLVGLLIYALQKPQEVSPEQLFKVPHEYEGSIVKRMFNWLKYNF